MVTKPVRPAKPISFAPATTADKLRRITLSDGTCCYVPCQYKDRHHPARGLIRSIMLRGLALILLWVTIASWLSLTER